MSILVMYIDTCLYMNIDMSISISYVYCYMSIFILNVMSIYVYIYIVCILIYKCMYIDACACIFMHTKHKFTY